MTFDLRKVHPHHETHTALTVAATAVLLTGAFHFLVADRPYGIPFAIFMALLVAGIEVLAAFSGKQGNAWASLFLIPAGFGILSEALFASTAVRIIGFLLVPLSLAFFAYWRTAPKTAFQEIPSLWPGTLARETLAPFHNFGKFFEGLRGGRNSTGVLLGVALALPFLLVIGILFASADPLFSKFLGDFLKKEKFFEYFAKTVRDGIVLLFLLGSGWTILTRALEARRPRNGAPARVTNRTIVATFLALLNGFFLVFLAFQFAYFFGGESVIRDYDIPYATYAREGFFQLLAVAAIVFCIAWVIYRATEMRQWATRELTLLLMLQTGIVIVSAVRRLVLYIDVYGLSLSRWWAMAVVLLIAALLVILMGSALAQIPYARLAKAVFPGLLIVVGALLLTNVDAQVARYNVERFLSGKTERLDIHYLASRLSSDAVPALVGLLGKQWPTESPETAPTMRNPYSRGELKRLLMNRGERLSEKMIADWRNLVLSEYRALAAIRTLEK